MLSVKVNCLNSFSHRTSEWTGNVVSNYDSHAQVVVSVSILGVTLANCRSPISAKEDAGTAGLGKTLSGRLIN